MKKKKGFTLIELLAVIVVLAIIALIATPIVMNTIKNSKKGAAERSGESYIKQVETAIMEYRMESGNTLPDGDYKIDSNGNLTGNGLTTPLTIEMNGTKPNDGTIKIENGQVSTTGTSMKFGDYTVSYDETKKTYVATENAGNTSNVLCTAVTELSTQYVNGQENIQTGVLASAGDPYAYGVEYTCELGDGEDKTFYVLETSNDNVSLIMNMNIDDEGKETTSGNTVAWCKSGSNNSCAADGALEYLASSTASWSKLNPSQISLPSAEQIATASGQTFSQTSISGLSTWLHENLSSSSAPYGYWTSTPIASGSDHVWIVDCGGYLGSSDFVGLDIDSVYGVRPVITISKAQLG